MKILFDANLSPALVTGLRTEYPASAHVRDVDLRSAPDAQIWEYARTHGFAIVSKDTDFRERSFVEGFQPRAVKRLQFLPSWKPCHAAGFATSSLDRSRFTRESFSSVAARGSQLYAACPRSNNERVYEPTRL